MNLGQLNLNLGLGKARGQAQKQAGTDKDSLLGQTWS
jgi:hypothetical protein